MASSQATTEPEYLRDTAMLELLYATGIRVSELCGIDLADVNYSRNTVKVTGKGNKQRVVPFGDPAASALKAWRDHGRLHLLNPKKPAHNALFLGARGGRIDPRMVRTVVARAGKQLGVEGLGPHSLRHSAATHMLDSDRIITLRKADGAKARLPRSVEYDLNATPDYEIGRASCRERV